jgi:hypothetical protein
VLSDVEQRKADRLRVMRAVYALLGDETGEYVDLWAIRDALGLDDNRMANAVDFLEGEGLIDTIRTFSGQRTPMHARIEHAGLREMERAEEALPQAIDEQRTPPQAVITESGVREIVEARRAPEEPTAYFPPFNSVTINIGGGVYGSAFQVASPGAAQNADIHVEMVASGDAKRIQALLSEYYVGGHSLSLSCELKPDEFAEVLAEVGTLQSQVNSPRPKAATIRLSLATIKQIVERASSDASRTKLLLLLSEIKV